MVVGGAWLQGGMSGSWGVCMVARGVHGCQGGMHGCGGVCMVAWGCMVAGGHVWLWGGACMVARRACIGYDKIQSMSGQYASYWNAFLFHV